MMHGVVDRNCEAKIRLAIGNADGRRQMIDALIDTGFTGFLMLPMSVVMDLSLKVYRRETGILADGSRRTFDMYRVSHFIACCNASYCSENPASKLL